VVCLRFNDGEERVVDVSGMLWGTMGEPLGDPDGSWVRVSSAAYKEVPFRRAFLLRQAWFACAMTANFAQLWPNCE
jgi:hypothetical protein